MKGVATGIVVQDNTLEELKKLKLELNLNTYDDVIQYLIKTKSTVAVTGKVNIKDKLTT